MKLRYGFVSNSSTTSFCIMGIVVPGDLVDKNYDKIDEMKLDKHQSFQESDDYVVGLSATEMKDDETLQQFKSRIVAMLKEVFPDVDTKTIGWAIDGWYNG